MSDSRGLRSRLRRLGHWAAVVFAAFVVGALIWTWFISDSQRQDKLLRTAIFGMAGYCGFLIWMVFGSRWPARARWAVSTGTFAVGLFCGLCLRISGVTGDLLPIVEWRWKQPRTISVAAGSATNVNLSIKLNGSYPQFLGPTRDGVLPGPKLARDWKQTSPGEIWRHPIGAAWSGFTIEGGRAITQEQRGEDELVVCYDLLSGAGLWSHADKSRYATTIAGEGPRATPTISSNRVYSIGGAGVLNCLDLATGQVIWMRDTMALHGAKVPEWGVASSPLVTERAVIVAVGGSGRSLVAYDKHSGAVLWAGGNDNAHWSSPVRVTLEGVPQILIFSENVSSHDERTGQTLWQYPWRNPYPHVSIPLLLSSNRLLVSQGYGTGSELLQVSRETNRWHARQIWKSIRLKSKFANLIQLDGYVYGLDDGGLVCIDVASGALKWKGNRYGHGQMILVSGLLLMMAENGDIVLIEPNPNDQRELARFKVFNAKTWNPPALAGDLLVVRNDREAACLRLPTLP